MRTVPPYTVLAGIYDYVMRHVPYEAWAVYVATVVERYMPEARRLLEFGCGTGSLAFSLEALGYEVWGADSSEAMLRVACKKADLRGSAIRWIEADVRGPVEQVADRNLDVVLMLHDGLNYLLDPAELEGAIRNMARLVRPGGLVIFDISTPENSRRNLHDFEEEVETADFRYRRRNDFDPQTRLHRTIFEVYLEGSWWREEHRERAYSQQEIDTILSRIPELEHLATWEEFTYRRPRRDAERLLYVMRRWGG
jgi:SAM-dependent methyltransferase|nr:MAG: methyltransferase [Bacteroidota bacterium]